MLDLNMSNICDISIGLLIAKISIKLIKKIYNSCINTLKKPKDPSESSEPSETSETTKIDDCYCVRDLLQQNPNPPYDIPDYFKII